MVVVCSSIGMLSMSNIIRQCSRINSRCAYSLLNRKPPKVLTAKNTNWSPIQWFHATLESLVDVYTVELPCRRLNGVTRNFLSSISANESSKESEKLEDASQSAAESKDSLSEKEKEILEKNQRLQERLNELDDKYKRSLAENENIRMRMRREIADAKQYGIQNFVRDLLDVADVLNKATETVPEAALSDNSHLKNLYEGLQMTESQLHSVFRRYGVTQVNPLGEKFDPNVHEALFEQDDPEKEPGTVGLVTKVGYKLQDRIIRPALVGVVKSRS